MNEMTSFNVANYIFNRIPERLEEYNLIFEEMHNIENLFDSFLIILMEILQMILDLDLYMIGLEQ
jgi:hypothetical protein